MSQVLCHFVRIAEERTVSLGSFMRNVKAAEAQFKMDGECLMVYHTEGSTTFRNRADLVASGDELPRLTSAVKRLFGKHQVVLVGELVGKGGFYGKDGFLRNRSNRDALTLVLFDLLELDGESLRGRPFIERWHKLGSFFTCNKSDVIALVPSQTVTSATEARNVFKLALSLKNPAIEGIVVKPHDSLYRDMAWLKVKNEWTDDLKLCGVRKTEHLRETGIASSWLLQTFSGEKKGHVGSGLDWSSREALTSFVMANKTAEDHENIYCKPVLTLEIKHCGDLGDSFRSPSIVRVRFDK